jgi:hypothetical protein
MWKLSLFKYRFSNIAFLYKLSLFKDCPLYNKQKNTWVLGNTRFISRVEHDISLVRCAHSWDIMFNTRNKSGISAHPCIILYIISSRRNKRGQTKGGKFYAVSKFTRIRHRCIIWFTETEDWKLTHSRPQSHFRSVTRWKLGSGLDN